MDPRAQKIIEFLRDQVLADRNAELDEQTPLVSSGLIDSFALVEVLTKLEDVTGLRIPVGRVSPLDLETVSRMLAVADQWGEPSG